MKLRLWKNDKRKGETHPHLKNGKPQAIECPHCKKSADHWISAWINASEDSTKEGVNRMVDKLEAENGTYAILTLDVSPAEEQKAAAPRDYGDPDDQPF